MGATGETPGHVIGRIGLFRAGWAKSVTGSEETEGIEGTEGTERQQADFTCPKAFEDKDRCGRGAGFRTRP